MNWQKIEGNWNQIKGKVKERWGRISDDQLNSIAGKRDQLVAALQQAYSFPRDEADRQVVEWEKIGDRIFGAGAPAERDKELRRKVG